MFVKVPASKTVPSDYNGQDWKDIIVNTDEIAWLTPVPAREPGDCLNAKFRDGTSIFLGLSAETFIALLRRGEDR